MAPNPKTLKAATRTVAATKAARHQVKPVRATPGASAGGPARVGPAWQPSRRAEFLVDTLGNKLIASLLRVAESQPSRWRRAEEVPSPRVAPILVDLDHIVGRLLLIWDKSVIGDWLTDDTSVDKIAEFAIKTFGKQDFNGFTTVPGRSTSSSVAGPPR